MIEIDVVGKSRDEINQATANVRRAGLLDLIHELANVEPHYSPRTIARQREMSPRRLVEMCKAGEMPGTHKPMQNGWRISRSGLWEWDMLTCVTPLRTRADEQLVVRRVLLIGH